MDICIFILLNSSPVAWIAVGCLSLILLLIVTILLLLKSREVATLKKQCEDLNETMRMMRYEEANLSRMLHTASKPDEPTAEVAASEEEGKPEEPAEELSEEAVAVVAEEPAAPEAMTETPALPEEEASQSVVSQPRKQGINERRPAIPTDLFAAWFAENEGTVAEEPTETVEETAETVAVAESETAEPTVQDAIPGPPVEEMAASQDTETVAEEDDPDSPAVLNKEDERFCRKLERIVSNRLRNPNLNIDIIAAQFGIGRTDFYRKVRELTGISPNDYLRKCRLERAAELLCSTEQPINDVCAQVGIPDAQYFSRVFKAYFGVSPSVYREQHNQ